MELKIEYLPTGDLIPYARNSRTHTDEQVAQVAASIREFGFASPVLIGEDKTIIAGHCRVMAAQKLGLETVPTITATGWTEAQKRAYVIVDNRLAENAGWDAEMLKTEFADLDDLGFDLSLLGFDAEGLDEILGDGAGLLQDGYTDENGGTKAKFIVPPFSVLDARAGYWNERKRAWKQKISDTSETRENVIMYSSITNTDGTSIFDPVLAECICRWFLPNDGGQICDPFAGGGFGQVAVQLGHRFTGIEIRQEQADLNNRNIGAGGRYICDSGENIAAYLEPETQDMVFSCPPYFNLEKYSDLPNDASNQDWKGFCRILRAGIRGALSCLKKNRFAVFVMSNVRDKRGYYLDICAEIKDECKANGAFLYNEIILATPIGSAALRCGVGMKTRKVCRVHQEVLVFYKGDSGAIKREFPELDYDVDEMEAVDED